MQAKLIIKDFVTPTDRMRSIRSFKKDAISKAQRDEAISRLRKEQKLSVAYYSYASDEIRGLKHADD